MRPAPSVTPAGKSRGAGDAEEGRDARSDRRASRQGEDRARSRSRAGRNSTRTCLTAIFEDSTRGDSRLSRSRPCEAHRASKSPVLPERAMATPLRRLAMTTCPDASWSLTDAAMQASRIARRFVSAALLAVLWAQAAAVEAQPPLVTRVHGIATGIAACWRPPHDDDQVTVRLSFTREGAVIGEPRIVFARSSGGAADDSGARQFHVGGDTRMHAVAFLRPARLCDRGAGSGHSLHWPQPGDHRRAALRTSTAPSLVGRTPDEMPPRLRESIYQIFASRRHALRAGPAKHAWRRAESRCLGA